ncbi:MAG: DUF975 family protein [Peptococcaceae bacterium]|nr:DUF975 family protein [Peptococcaceae bacterium]
MWSREFLKTHAKGVLRKHYWMVFLACFIFTIISGVGGSISSVFSNAASLVTSGYSVYEGQFLITLGVTMLVVAFITILIGYALKIFVLNLIEVGLCRYLMETRLEKVDLGTLFWAFREGRYMKVVKTMFFYDLHIFLWSLLFIIPGIVKYYQYRYVPYILAENPDIDTRRVLDLSRTMTHGEKGSIFVLDLSFLGWGILGCIACCGIGIYFLVPYMEATYAELYAFVRERSLDQNIADSNELKGFEGPPSYPHPYSPGPPQN